MKRLTTVNQVIKALGGIEKVRELTGANNKQSWNWTEKFGSFPSRYYACMTLALLRAGYQAPARLWAQKGHIPKKPNVPTDSAA